MTYKQALATAFLLAVPSSKGKYLEKHGGNRVWQILCLRRLKFQAGMPNARIEHALVPESHGREI